MFVIFKKKKKKNTKHIRIFDILLSDVSNPGIINKKKEKEKERYQSTFSNP